MKKSLVIFFGLIFFFSILFSVNFVSAQVAEKLTLNFEGAVIEDKSPSAHPATIIGEVVLSSAQKVCGGQSALFDGNRDAIEFSDSPDWNFNTEDLTMEYWVHPLDYTPSINVVYSQGESFGLAGLLASFGSDTDPNSYFRLQSNPPVGMIVNVDKKPALNEWTHFAYVRENGFYSLFINGVLINQAGDSGPAADFNTPLHIGGFDPTIFPGFSVQGYIDDLSIKKGVSKYSATGFVVGEEVFIPRCLDGSVPALAQFPQGISSVTGTVGVTSATDGHFGDTLTITGGLSGGEVNVVDSADVLTTKISVPANTETSLSINSAGESTIFSTTATSSNPLKFENLKTTFLNMNIKGQHEVVLRLGSQQGIVIYHHGVSGFGFKPLPENTQEVQFSISPGASSDCNPETCTSLGGHCVGNWCMPGTEIADAFSTGKTSISGKLSPAEDLGFRSEQTLSGENVLSLETTSGLLNSLKFRKINNVFAELKMSANSKTDFFVNELKGTAFIVPNSPGIELTSLASQAGMNFYGLKVRELRQGQLSVAAPANYKFETNGDIVFDTEYNSKSSNTFFSKVFGSGYVGLSPTMANGWTMVAFSSQINPAPTLTVTHNGVAQRKILALNDATAYNFIIQRDRLGNEVTVAGNSRTILGSLIEEVSPEAIIEGWNYWYTATDDNYWTWSVVLESLPAGCTADKTSASTTVANGVQTLAFYVDCGTASATTGSVISGFATKGQKTGFATKGFATKGRAQLLSSFTDCTKVLPNGEHQCTPSQQFREEAAEVVKGVMNPTGSVVSELEKSGLPIFLVALLTLAGVIVLIALQINRKTVNW